VARIQRRVPAAGRPAPAKRGAASSAPDPAASGRRVKRKVPLKHLVRFTRLLATLSEAGLPVLRNLNILSDQWPPGRFRDTVLDAADMVEEGQPLSDALAQHPEVFDDLFVNMARAGEAGGVLDQVLNRLADFMESSQEMRDRTRSAMVYPVVILIVALGVITGLLVGVIPKFAELFQDMDIELPAPTRMLISVSEFLQQHWYLLLVPVVFYLLYQLAYFRSYGFRRWNHSWWLKLPGLGRLMKTGQISRFSSTFGTLVASGVPHLRAFDIVRGALTNEVYRETIDAVQEEVREGESISTALETSGRFDDVVVSMVEVGEETGELDRMCLRVGGNYETNYARALDVMVKLLEPIMLLIMATLVGLIAFAMFLPLFKLLEQFGQQAG